MKITRNVILDLLPLYAANEVSEDTRIMVEEYLATDTELANTAQRLKNQLCLDEIPFPLKREDKMEAYLAAQKILWKRTALWASIAAMCLVFCLSLAALAFFKLMQFFP